MDTAPLPFFISQGGISPPHFLFLFVESLRMWSRLMGFRDKKYPNFHFGQCFRSFTSSIYFPLPPFVFFFSVPDTFSFPSHAPWVLG